MNEYTAGSRCRCEAGVVILFVFARSQDRLSTAQPVVVISLQQQSRVVSVRVLCCFLVWSRAFAVLHRAVPP